MNDELFHQLTASLKEGGAILRGKTPASRTSSLQSPVGWRGAASIRRWISSALEMRVACASVSALWLAAGPRCGRATARPVVTIPGCRPGTGCPLDGLNPARNPGPRPAQPKRRGGLRPSRRTPHLRRAGAAQGPRRGRAGVECGGKRQRDTALARSTVCTTGLAVRFSRMRAPPPRHHV